MSEAVHDAQRLKELQALPLDRKIQISQARIIEWYTRNKGNVVVSFSGGKDSTVLLHLVRSLFPDVRAVFSNTGLEYTEIQRFVRSVPNVTIVAPKVSFHEVLSTCGYPLIGKEVAEAIYYARRLRSQNLNVEREREREQERRNAVEAGRALRLPENERGGGTSGTSDENSSEPGHFIDISGAKNRRTVLTGKWGAVSPDAHTRAVPKGGGYLETDRRRKDCLGLWQTDNLQANRTWGGQSKSPWTGDYSNPGTWKRWDLNGRRRAGVTSEQDGATGEGGVFSPESKEVYGEKSLFNKEKWLPMATDLPVAISHLCCHRLKKAPMIAFQKSEKLLPFLGTLAEESRIRTQAWIRNGCNAFDAKKPQSTPIAFWTEQDILQYIVEYGLDIAPIYGEIVAVGNDGNEYPTSSMMCAGCKLKCTGADRTGCIYCAFGFHNEKGETRFQRLARTHPRQYEYCMGGGQWADNPAYDPTAPEYDGEWKNWNPPKIWVPSKIGLGMKVVFDMVNEIYGKDFYRYE